MIHNDRTTFIKFPHVLVKKKDCCATVGGARVIWGHGKEQSLLIGSWIVPLGVSGNTSGRGGRGVVFSE